jgi:hypothetical protein
MGTAESRPHLAIRRPALILQLTDKVVGLQIAPPLAGILKLISNTAFHLFYE